MKAKKLLSLLLLIAMTISMFVPVQAADTSGKIGDNVTWTYDASTKTITLSGSGATYDYTLDKTTYTTGSPLEDYDFNMTEKFIIEDGITYLGDYIFFGGDVSEIYIPKSVTKIKGNAFGVIFDFDNTHVYYAGTESEWNALDRDSDFYFEEAIMHYGAASNSSNVNSAPVTSTPQTSTATTTKATQTAPSSNAIKVYIDNKIVSFDVQPQLIGGRTMVPLRAIFEGLGATVEWDNNTQTVTAYNEVKIVKATIGSNTMTVNGANKTMDVAPMIVDGRTLVPARFVAEAFDCDVEWDGNTKTVSITTKPIDYSKVEQDISVTAPSTSTTEQTKPSVIPSTSTKTETKSDVQEEPAQETIKSDKPYKVETLAKDSIKSKTLNKQEIYLITTMGDVIYYVPKNNDKIIKALDMVTGETSTYKDLTGFVYEDYDIYDLGISTPRLYDLEFTAIECIYHDKARDTIVALCEFEYYDHIFDKNYSEDFVLNLSNNKLIKVNTLSKLPYIWGTNEDGDLIQYSLKISMTGGEGSNYGLILNYHPQYNVEMSVTDKKWMLEGDGRFIGERKTPIYAEYVGSELELTLDASAAPEGFDGNKRYKLNTKNMVIMDRDKNLIDNCSYSDIELVDGEELFNKKFPKLFINSNEDIIFYDFGLDCFRKISKNN